MPKTKKPKSSQSLVPAARTLLRLGLAGALVAFAGWGYHRLCNQVEYKLAVSAHAPQVVLRNQPLWMNDELAEQIVRSVAPRAPRSAMDHELLREIAERLAQNPWVKKVRQVRRSYTESVGDTVEIVCEYRAPAALVSTGKEFLLVDGDGVRLPPSFPVVKGADGHMVAPQVMFAADHTTSLRIIEGVGAPAPLAGSPWGGQDLQAGLDLAKLLYGKGFAEAIYRIDVSNYNRRFPDRGPCQITLVTKDHTRILWGEPVRSSFFAEVPPQQKLERLSELVKQYGRVDANHSWVDIRMPKVQIPEGEKMAQGN